MAESREPDGPPLQGMARSPACQSDLGDQLKVMFGDVSSGPMPSRLLDLAERLEEALQRGDLFECAKRRTHAG